MLKILLSFLLSLVPLWLLGAIFLTSPTVCRWDDSLGLPIPVAGTCKQEREENWNSFIFGQLGLEKNDAERLASAEVLIFGDSYIEADMVSPQERMQNKLSEMGIPAVGIGVSGNSCVENYHLMGIYNKLVPNVTTNVILIADITDILPPERTTDFLSLKPAYPFRKIEGRLGEISYYLRLMAFRNLLKKAKMACHNCLDWQGNHWRDNVTNIESKECLDTSHYEEYWRNMLSALKNQAPNGRLMIVYVPIVPSIQDNSLSTSNDDAEIIRRFSKVCVDFNLIGGGLIDISPRLCDYASCTRRLPRGFFNTKPGAGHLNGDGHRLVANAISEVLTK
jgi:hypothetical protein